MTPAHIFALRSVAMGLGRRKARLEDAGAWVFNRMAQAYEARPPYPVALIEHIHALASAKGPRLLDVGAGIGHLALPLQERGLEVTALEPAAAMLAVLEREARARALPLRALHGTAEALQLPADSFDCVLIADALHFLDAELAALQIRNVLCRGGELVLVTCGLGETPYMRAVAQIMAEAAPRRARDVGAQSQQLAALCGVTLSEASRFDDETPVSPDEQDRILASISFIGPAMNEARTQAFRERIRALSATPIWARQISLRHGVRR